jgi:hypothetical protein
VDDIKQFKLGVIPSNPDSRDFHINQLVGAGISIPKAVKLDISKIPVKNQGSINSCVGHSISYIREYWEQKQSGGTLKQFSPGFVYGNRQVYNNYLTNINLQGMMPSWALNNLLKCGIPYFKDFPYNVEVPQIRELILQKKDELLNKAYKFRITGYARLHSINEVKVALENLGLVFAVIPIYESFYRTGSDGKVPTPNLSKEKFIGLHAVTIYAINEYGEIDFLNSWGQQWGDKGYGHLSVDFPLEEMWALSDKVLPTDISKPDLSTDNEHEVMNILDQNTNVFTEGVVGLNKAIEIANQEKYHGHYITIYRADFVEMDRFISPKQVQREEILVNDLIIFYGDADAPIAQFLNYFIGGYVVSEYDYLKQPIKANRYIKIGGSYKPEGNVVMLSGTDRKETAKKVLNYINTL